MKITSFEIEWLPPAQPEADPVSECVPSPCVGVCTLDDEQVCIGCSRTAAEIAARTSLSDGEKQAVLDRIETGLLGGSGEAAPVNPGG